MNTTPVTGTRTGILASVAYPAICILLWFSLMLHFRMGLGYWPDRINVEPSTSAFRIHADITRFLLALGPAVLVTSVLSSLLCLVHPRTRFFARYPALLAITCALGAVMMKLSPNSFLNWWLD